MKGTTSWVERERHDGVECNRADVDRDEEAGEDPEEAVHVLDREAREAGDARFAASVIPRGRSSRGGGRRRSTGPRRVPDGRGGGDHVHATASALAGHPPRARPRPRA